MENAQGIQAIVALTIETWIDWTGETDADDDERCPPMFTDDSDTIDEDDNESED